jgi:hypothetical protein
MAGSLTGFNTLKYTVLAVAVVVGCFHTVLWQSFAIESKGIPQSRITLSIPS